MSQDAHRVAIVAARTRRVADALGDRITRLGREGFEVDILARPNGRTDELVDRGATVVPTPWGDGVHPLRTVSAYVIVQSHMLQHSPMLVHGFGIPMAWLGALAADQVPAPAIFATIEDHRWEPGDFGGVDSGLRAMAPGTVRALEEAGADIAGGLVVEGREWMYRQTAKRSDAYFVSCRRDAARLRTRDIVDHPKMQRMEPGVGIDVTRFDPEDDTLPSQAEVRDAFDVPADWRTVLVYRGDGRATRGTMDLLEVIEALGRRRPEIGWLVSLRGPVRDRVARRFEALARADRVVLVDEDASSVTGGGPTDRAVMMLRAADVVVEPSLQPEVSLRAMEGSAMQRPVVGYDTSAQRAVVLDGQTGRLAPRGSVEMLTETLLDLIDDPSRLEDLSMRAGARAHEHFDRAEIDQNTLQKYDTVLSNAIG